MIQIVDRALVCDYDDDVVHPWKCQKCDTDSGGDVKLKGCTGFDAVDSVKTPRLDKLSSMDNSGGPDKLVLKKKDMVRGCSIEEGKQENQLQCGEEHQVKVTRAANIKVIGYSKNMVPSRIYEGTSEKDGKEVNYGNIENLFAREIRISDEFIDEHNIQFEIDREVSKNLKEEHKENSVGNFEIDNFRVWNKRAVRDHKVHTKGKEYFDFRDKVSENLEVTLSPEYSSNWGQEKAIREFVSNALDVTSDENSLELKREEGNWVLYYDTDAKLENEHWVMGKHESYKSEDKVIGQFGEGIKMGSLALHNKGINIKIEGIGYTWYPVVERSEQFGTPILSVYKVPNDREQGTKITFTNLNDEDIRDGKRRFLKFRDNWKVIDSIEWEEKKEKGENKVYDNEIIEFDEGTKIAIRDVIVDAEGNTLFSYNIDDKKIQDRDRDKIKNSDIRKHVKPTIEKTDNKDIIKKVIDALEEGKKEEEANMGFDPVHSEIWKKIIKDKFGDKIVRTSHSTVADLNAENRGYEVIDWGFGNGVLRNLDIPNSKDIEGSKGTIPTISSEKLTGVQKENLELAYRSLQHLRKHFWGDENPELKPNKINIAKTFDKADVDENAQGYNNFFGNHKIYIHQDQLKDPVDATGVMIHEYIHNRTGASDESRRFENIFTDISGMTTNEWYGTEEELKTVKKAIRKKAKELGVEEREGITEELEKPRKVKVTE